jgi:hypothetical protein
MAQAKISVTTKSGGKSYDSLNAWIKDVGEDLKLVLPAVAMAEYQAQREKGNPPSNILVDGKPGSPSAIAGADKRVQMFFLDVELLARAVTAAYDELRRLYTRATGRSAATIQIWGRTVKGGGGISHQRLGGIGQVREWLTANKTPGTFVRLIGPDVPFRRRLYYTPPGASASFRNISRVSEQRLGELERAGARARVVSRARGRKRQVIQIEATTNINELVVAKLKALFGRSLYINARWIQVPVPPWKGSEKARQGVPAVALGWWLKGAQP